MRLPPSIWNQEFRVGLELGCHCKGCLFHIIQFLPKFELNSFSGRNSGLFLFPAGIPVDFIFRPEFWQISFSGRNSGKFHFPVRPEPELNLKIPVPVKPEPECILKIPVPVLQNEIQISKIRFQVPVSKSAFRLYPIQCGCLGLFHPVWLS